MVDGERLDLVWAGAYYTPTGYGEEARGFTSALDQGRFNLKIIPLFGRINGIVTPEQEHWFANLERTPVETGQAVVVHHYPPDLFNEDIRGRVNISRTMFESDRIPDVWVEQSRHLDEIWVPCHFNLDTFTNSGIPRHKIQVIPGGVDTNKFHPEAPPLNLGPKKGFAFFSLFIWTDHKGWDVLLTAYCTEFKPEEEVMLLIKTSKPQRTPGSINEQYSSFMNRLNPRQHALPIIWIIDSNVADCLMPSLYTACDAFVLPSRGEAWGRPYIEAMACGLPVIGTKWSGNLEFMNGENSYLIEIEGLEDVPGNAENAIYQGHKWSKPSVEHLRQLMRHVFENRHEAKAKGKKARADVCRRWTWKQVASAAMKELAKYSNTK